MRTATGTGTYSLITGVSMPALNYMLKRKRTEKNSIQKNCEKLENHSN